MGGNAFDDLQKLTPEEYAKITQELYDLISPMCVKIEPYIPLPEKEVHGDIDFLILFKEGYSLQSVIELMKIPKQEYILNNNLTANTVYKKKQIDFNITLSPQQFQRCRFYKSYSGIGAFLGLLLPSKYVKFNEQGIFCCCYKEHYKMEYNVCSDVPSIMKFYGLNQEKYDAGFKTKKQVFNFLLEARFHDPKAFRDKKPKWTTKLINGFQNYLLEHEELVNPHYEFHEDAVSMTLKYFGKEKEFEVAFEKMLQKEKNKKERSKKWNGKHIIDIFGIPSKELNLFKRKFEESFGGKDKYEQFIEQHSFEEIIQAFSKACKMEPVENKNDM